MKPMKVHALGPSGSGKTVLMGSLYSRLRIRRPDYPFYLRTTHEASLALNAIFNEVANPEESWPEASQDIKEWRFTFCVPTQHGAIEPLAIEYLDYPGGSLTNPRAMADSRIQRLVSQLREAHGLLILLDGMAMRGLVDGERAGKRYLEFDLTSSLEIAQQTRSPVHFAITKWDLLHPKYSLESVRDALMANDNFRDLLESKRGDGTGAIRLIPISGVGNGFAEVQDDGTMRKTGASPRPMNVEMPLIFIVPDFLRFAHDQVTAREEQLSAQVAARSEPATAGDNRERAGRFARLFADTAQRYAPQLVTTLARQYPALQFLANNPAVIAAAVSGFADRMTQYQMDRAQVSRDQYLGDLDKARLLIESEKDALLVLERRFEMMIAEFDALHPASLLIGPTRPSTVA